VNGLPSAREIAVALGGKSIGRGEVMAKCPAHQERTPSLSIRDGHSGPLVFCFGGCSQAEVIAALQSLDQWPRYDREEDDKKACRKCQERARKAAVDRLDDEAQARAKIARDLLRAKGILRESIAPTANEHCRHLPHRPRHRSPLAGLHP